VHFEVRAGGVVRKFCHAAHCVTDLNSLLIKKTGIFTKRCSKEDKERSQNMKEKISIKKKE
jgi:hypothetical protein